jgi:hypothetical protein
MSKLKLMNKNILKDNRGIAPLIIVAVVAIIAVLAGGGIYLAAKKSPEQKKAQGLSNAQNSIDQVGVSILDLNFSQSPLPDLKISALNVSAPNLNSGGNIFTAPSVNANFSYDASSINISTPSVSSYNIKMPTMPTVPVQNQQPPASQQPPADPTGGQQGPSSADCAQFAAPPSCSYVGAPGSQGYELCKQCYPNK